MHRIYKASDSQSVFFNTDKKSELIFSGVGSGNFIFQRGKLAYEFYDSGDIYKGRYYRVLGKVYRRLASVTDGQSNFVDNDGAYLELPREFIDTIFPFYPTDEDPKVYLAVLRDVPKKFKFSLAILNLETKKVVHRLTSGGGSKYLDGNAYVLARGSELLEKLDNNLETIWSYRLPRAMLNATFSSKYHGNLLAFLGPEKEDTTTVNGRGQFTQSGGELVALNDADGALNWKREFPSSVDEFHLVDDKLYVLSLNEVLVLDPASGQEIGRIDTQTSVPFNRMMRPTIFLDQSYLYYTHYDDALILVYDRETLSLAKRIDMPEGYRVKRHDFHDTRTGKHYFVLHNLTQYGALWPILELEPNDLDAPVEFEPEPEMQIDFLPSQDGQPGRELVIRLRTESLDDALRFGEIYTRDHAQWHSYNYMGMSFAGRQPTPEFNGLIRYQYSGCNQPRDVVEEHLRVMEERFKKWNAKEGFYSCIDKKQPLRLVAEWVEG